MTLHERLLAAIETAESDAREVQTSPAALVEVDHCTCYGGNLPQGHEPGCGSEPGLAWHLASAMLRGLTEDRDVLHRHSAGTAMPSGRRLCRAHPVSTGPYLDECDELLSVARRHGVPIEEA